MSNANVVKEAFNVQSLKCFVDSEKSFKSYVYCVSVKRAWVDSSF